MALLIYGRALTPGLLAGDGGEFQTFMWETAVFQQQALITGMGAVYELIDAGFSTSPVRIGSLRAFQIQE